MAQGGLLAMVAYGIVVLPFIRQMKSTYPDVTQPWYAYNVGALGICKNIELYFNLQKKLAWVVVITPNYQKLFLLCTRVILKPETVWLTSQV